MGSIQIYGKTAAEWTADNDILLDRQPGLETDTRKVKYGDGVTAWNSLQYATTGGGGSSTWGGITGTLSDQTDLQTALDAKADKSSTLLTGGIISIVSSTTIRVSASTFYILGSGNYSAIQTDFAGITLSSSGTQRYIGLYGTTSNTISKLEGSEAALAVFPTQPANTALIGYVLVSDAAVSTTPDLSGYLLKSDKATQASNILGTNDATYITPLANATKARALTPRPVDTTNKLYFYSSVYINQPSENHAVILDSIRGNPLFVSKTATLNALSIRVASTAVAGTNARFAIYSSTIAGLPAAKLWEGTNFSLNTGAAATIIVTGIGLSLTPGLYYLFLNASASSGLIRTLSNGSSGEILGHDMTGTQAVAITGYVFNSISFGSAFPADLSLTTPSVGQGTNVPAIYAGFL